MKHVAIYSRNFSNAITNAEQLGALDRWASSQVIRVEQYQDNFVGKATYRPSWAKLCIALRAGRLASICCWRLDRLGLAARQLTSLFEELRERNVNLVSIREGFNFSTSAGRVATDVVVSLAQFESEELSARLHATREAARVSRKQCGGRMPNSKFAVTEEQIELVQRMAAEGKSKVAISKASGLSRPTVYSILSRQQERVRV